MGGGTGKIGAGSGYAVGDSAAVLNDGFGDLSNNGVAIKSATVNSGAGNIIINGNGYGMPGLNGSDGVSIGSGAVVQSTTGNITINGTGGCAGQGHLLASTSGTTVLKSRAAAVQFHLPALVGLRATTQMTLYDCIMASTPRSVYWLCGRINITGIRVLGVRNNHGDRRYARRWLRRTIGGSSYGSNIDVDAIYC